MGHCADRLRVLQVLHAVQGQGDRLGLLIQDNCRKGNIRRKDLRPRWQRKGRRLLLIEIHHRDLAAGRIIVDAAVFELKALRLVFLGVLHHVFEDRDAVALLCVASCFGFLLRHNRFDRFLHRLLRGGLGALRCQLVCLLLAAAAGVRISLCGLLLLPRVDRGQNPLAQLLPLRIGFVLFLLHLWLDSRLLLLRLSTLRRNGCVLRLGGALFGLPGAAGRRLIRSSFFLRRSCHHRRRSLLDRLSRFLRLRIRVRCGRFCCRGLG